jgi:hypothetical protein
VSDVFVRDRLLGTTTLVSNGVNGAASNGYSAAGQISADGTVAAFSSMASNLVAGDANGFEDVFVVDLVGGAITLASVAADGTQGDGDSYAPRLSADGLHVAFDTSATSFPAPPFYAVLSVVYAKDLATGELERIDVDPSGVGDEGGTQFVRSISTDGSLVSFETWSALVLEDGNDYDDLYLRDRVARTTERVSLATGGRELDRGVVFATMSPDARFVVITSDARNVVDEDHNSAYDVFLRDRLVDVTTRISVGTLDEEGYASYAWGLGDVISSDAKAVVFESVAPDFAANDTNIDLDVFLRTRDRLAPSWTNYGTGFPGRDGVVPTMTPDRDPIRGASLQIGIGCSARLYTAAFVFLGLTRDSIPTSLGGTLLLDPLLVVPIALTPFGGSLVADVPTNYWANGLVVDLQTLELDPFAAKGVSFTDGLELVLGDG